MVKEEIIRALKTTLDEETKQKDRLLKEKEEMEKNMEHLVNGIHSTEDLWKECETNLQKATENKDRLLAIIEEGLEPIEKELGINKPIKEFQKRFKEIHDISRNTISIQNFDINQNIMLYRLDQGIYEAVQRNGKMKYLLSQDMFTGTTHANLQKQFIFGKIFHIQENTSDGMNNIYKLPKGFKYFTVLITDVV